MKHKKENSPERIRTVVNDWGQVTKVVHFALKSWGVFTESDTLLHKRLSLFSFNFVSNIAIFTKIAALLQIKLRY